jgi:hypothetical protein
LKKGVKPQKGVPIREDQKEFKEEDYRIRIRVASMVTKAMKQGIEKLSLKDN